MGGCGEWEFKKLSGILVVLRRTKLALSLVTESNVSRDPASIPERSRGRLFVVEYNCPRTSAGLPLKNTTGFSLFTRQIQDSEFRKNSAWSQRFEQ